MASRSSSRTAWWWPLTAGRTAPGSSSAEPRGREEDLVWRRTDTAALRFTRTRTTVKLSSLGSTLMSRSEARRVVQRLTDFTHAVLDFTGVDMVGQGFCDEVFRSLRARTPRSPSNRSA